MESQKFYDILSDRLTNAYRVRKEFMVGETDLRFTDGPEELYDKLKRTRNGLDQLETLLNSAIMVKAEVERLRNKRLGDVEDAEVTVAESTRKGKDFQSARDRNIDVNMATISERRSLRQAEEVLIEARATVDVIRNMHRGLDSHRRDIETGLRALTMITTLER